eukprot:6179271-Pleurochrysis_carterae.AAC.4
MSNVSRTLWEVWQEREGVLECESVSPFPAVCVRSALAGMMTQYLGLICDTIVGLEYVDSDGALSLFRKLTKRVSRAL